MEQSSLQSVQAVLLTKYSSGVKTIDLFAKVWSRGKSLVGTRDYTHKGHGQLGYYEVVVEYMGLLKNRSFYAYVYLFLNISS